MLVITRQPGQSVIIGGVITLTLKEIKGWYVSLQIQASQGIPMHLQEVHRIMQSRNNSLTDVSLENIAASTNDPLRLFNRKVNEGVMIGNDIQVIVIGFQGRRVKIGINAPTNIDIVRIEAVIPEDLPHTLSTKQDSPLARFRH